MSSESGIQKDYAPDVDDDNTLDAQDVAEEVQDNDNNSNENFNEESNVEIDMRNNSTTYFDQHTDSVYLVASHPTLPLVVSGGGDNIAYLWTTSHSPPKLVAKLTDHSESVVAGGFTANGRFLVTGDMSGRLCVYKASAGGKKWSLLSNTQEVEEIVQISLHPTLSMFSASSADGQVWIYEISDELINLAVLNAHTLPTTATKFVPGDEEDMQPKLVSISEDGLIVLWDIYGQRALYTLDSTKLRGTHAWVSLCFSPTGQTIAVGGMDGILAIIKLADGSVLQMVDTTVVKLTKAEDEQANPEIDTEEEEQGYSIEGLDWSATGQLASGNVDGTVVFWDTKTWRPRFYFQMQDAVTQLEFVEGTKEVVVSSVDGTVVQYDVISSEKLWECLGHSEGVLGFTLQNKGQRVITAGDDHACLVFDKPNK